MAITTVTNSYSHYLYRQPTFIFASITSDSMDNNAQLNTYTCSHVHPQKLFPLQESYYLKVAVNEKLSCPLITTSKICSTPMLPCPYTYHEGSVDIAPRILKLSTWNSLNYTISYCRNIEVRHSVNYKPVYAVH